MKNAPSKSILKTAFFFILYSLGSFVTQAQNSFEIHAGPTFPVGDFSTTFEGAGGAGIGVGLGVEYTLLISENGHKIFFGFDFLYNDLKKETKDGVENILRSFGATIVKFDHSHYINSPLSAGLKYRLHQDEKLSIFMIGGITYNILNISDSEFTTELDDETFTSRIEYDIENRFGIKIGIAASIGNRAIVSLNYLGLGDHDIEGRTVTDDEVELLKGTQNVSLLSLAIGIKF
ncbi:hypothetical protein [Ekhidna sp.]